MAGEVERTLEDHHRVPHIKIHPYLALLAFVLLIMVGELWANAGTEIISHFFNKGKAVGWLGLLISAIVVTGLLFVTFHYAGITLVSFEKAQL